MNQEKANRVSLRDGMIGRFAIVKLWPELKTAEDECIARIKLAAAAIGVDCVEINFEGRPIADPSRVLTKSDVDFVIHLHYDTPKAYDIFSFVALWNPVAFYSEWGYQRTSRNLISHDDFLSCSSVAADDHVTRLIRHSKTHLPALFKLYHSTPALARTPSLGAGKLFYVGINWEAVSGGKSRHQNVLRQLDATGIMRIYGPREFLNVNVWAGYQSYVDEIPFDGVSMIDKIAEAGISLVFSSAAHKQSALMSNRLFESIAAGALVICDENPFAKKFFGDCLLYVDSRATTDEICSEIRRHVTWANTHRDEALAMIAEAQRRFQEQFALIKNLTDLYDGLPERKRALDQLAVSGVVAERHVVGVYLLTPKLERSVVERHIENANSQTAAEAVFTLVVDKIALESGAGLGWLDTIIATSTRSIRVLPAAFTEMGPSGKVRGERPLGQIVHAVIEDATDASVVSSIVLVAPNETIFSNHIAVLRASSMRNVDARCVATAAIASDGIATVQTVIDQIDFGYFEQKSPAGWARFCIKLSSLAPDLNLALPYLDCKPIAALLGDGDVVSELAVTVKIDVAEAFPARSWNQAAENAVLGDFCPKALRVYRGPIPDLPSLIPRPSYSAPSLPFSRFSKRWLVYQIKTMRERGMKARLAELQSRIGFGGAKT